MSEQRHASYLVALAIVLNVLNVIHGESLFERLVDERLDRIEEALGIAANEDNKGCPSNFRRFEDSCYHFGVVPLTWYQADQACQDIGASLVAIETYGEDDFVRRIIKSLDESSGLIGYWTSGNDLVPHLNAWRWRSTGLAIGPYSAWSPGQPNGPGGDCMIFYGADLWTWHDLTCTVNKYAGKGVGMVCEKSAAPC